MQKKLSFYQEPKQLAAAADLIRCLANPFRMQIVAKIRNEEASVGELSRFLSLSQSALSQHLAILRACQIVSTRRHMQTIYYSLSSDGAAALLETLDALCSEK